MNEYEFLTKNFEKINEQNKKEIEKLNKTIIQLTDNYNNLLVKQQEDSKKKKDSTERSQQKFNKLMKDKKVNLDNSDLGAEIRLNNEKLKNKFLKNSIAILSSEIDEVKDIFSNELQDFNIPSRPLSEKASSVASNNSRIGS